jgi:tRNA modification GTPase
MLVAGRFKPLSSRSLMKNQPGEVVVGHFHNTNGTFEELVVGIVDANCVEVHCHGGRAAVEAVTDSLTNGGCVTTSWQASIAEQTDDPLAAEALVALASACTERTAGILLHQYRGALREELKGTIELLERDELEHAGHRLQKLQSRSAFGQHLTAPWRIAIVGKPNVGKSSLINALLGYQRAIVYDQPGTTRDVLTARTAIDGWPVELLDTAGLRESSDPVESAGIAKTRDVVVDADLAILVYESGSPWTAEDKALLDELPSQLCKLIVYNKSDVGDLGDVGRPGGIAVSAKEGTNLQRLISEIAANIALPNGESPLAVPFTERHFAAIGAAREILAAGNGSLAIEFLSELIAKHEQNRSSG